MIGTISSYKYDTLKTIAQILFFSFFSVAYIAIQVRQMRTVFYLVSKSHFTFYSVDTDKFFDISN